MHLLHMLLKLKIAIKRRNFQHLLICFNNLQSWKCQSGNSFKFVMVKI